MPGPVREYRDCAECGGHPSRHPVRHILIHDDYAACVDEELADLVLALNARGIPTSECCQGDPGSLAHVSFLACDDLVRFLNIATVGAPDEALPRIVAMDKFGPDVEMAWKLGSTIVCQLEPPIDTLDDSTDKWAEARREALKAGWDPWADYQSVMFPKADIAWLTDLFGDTAED